MAPESPTALASLGVGPRGPWSTPQEREQSLAPPAHLVARDRQLQGPGPEHSAEAVGLHDTYSRLEGIDFIYLALKQ